MRALRDLLPGRPRSPADPADEDEAAAPSPPAAASVHVLRDDGLVRLVDGHLAWEAPGSAPQKVRLDEVAQLSVLGRAGVTTPCLIELMRRGIPVLWRTASGHYAGQSVDLSGRTSAVRRAQYRAAADPERSLAIARALIRAKILGQRGLIRRGIGANTTAAARLARLAGRAAVADGAALLGVEGTAAAIFYAALPQLVVEARRPVFPWDGRRRRPPIDPMNALLSYLYAILAGECAAAVLAAGLDPAVGFLHAERAGRPSLALDLMEPFRPSIADTVALAAVNRGEVRAEHFVVSPTSVTITDHGRRQILGALERRWATPVPGARKDAALLCWRDAIVWEARTLADALASGAPYRPAERA